MTPDYLTIEDIKRRNADTGHHFFDAGANRFFRSRTSDTVYQGSGGVFIVTSEQFEISGRRDARAYTPRKFDWETGSFEHFDGEPEFNTCTKSVAHRIARDAAKGERKVAA